MAKEKACKNCKRIYEGDICPVCDRKETSDSFKGKVEIIKSENSEISKNLKIDKEGIYAIKI
jgi:DNA-directed RNA polymerase subunit E"